MELVRFPSSRGFSVRSILTFVFTVALAALLWTPLLSTPVRAAGQAHWSGDTVIYEKRAFSISNSVNDGSGTIPEGATVYKTTVQNGTNTNPDDDKVMVLFFAPGVDPPTATTATYVSFSLQNGELLKPTGKTEVSVTEKSEQGPGSSCAVSGIGWIICPVSEFLAEGMDVLFGILAKLLSVQPMILGDTSNSLYVAWNIMRGFANVLFVVAFLIIIYSQLTSFGISNYGVKRTLPRLIVAAILVNLSFYISALAVDISNILGYSLQELFNTIRENVFHVTNDDLSGFNTSNAWATVTGVALAGAGVVGGMHFISSGSFFFLVPLLGGLALTLLFVIIILAARQAIIVILIILSPLAFVAFLLPNTEKLFSKWKDLFMTMLIFFPAFSIVFGGSQLAGQLIIQNAGDDFFMLLFGLAVQVAALALTPLILKFSGGLLGRIAQIANNPKRGLIDRSRNWAGDRANLHKQKNIAEGKSWGAKMVRATDYRKRNMKDKTDMYTQAATNRYNESRKAQAIQDQNAGVELDKERINATNAQRIERLKGSQASPLHNKAINAQVAKEGLQTAEQDLAGYHNTLRTVGGTSLNESQTRLHASKMHSEAAEKHNEAYLAEQRTFRFSQLGQAAERLEAAKLNAEGWQSRYTAHMESLKLTPNTPIHNAAVTAQVQKEAAESATANVQAMFDTQRAAKGTQLNLSTLELEAAKINAEQAKSYTTAYLNRQKSDMEGVLHVQHASAERAKMATQQSEAQLTRVMEEYKAGYTPDGARPELASIIEDIKTEHRNINIAKEGATNAIKVQQDNLADDFIKNEDLRVLAGGINERGADAAMARAITTVRNAFGQSVSEAREIVKHFNLSSDERQKLALGETITKVRDDGTEHTFTAEDIYAREAAIEDQIAVGTIDQVEEIVKRSGKGGDLYDFRTTISAALAKNGLGGKSIYLGGKTIDDVAKGAVLGDEGILDVAMQAVANGKVSERDLTNIDPVSIERFRQAVEKIMAGEIPSSLQGVDKDGNPKATPEKLKDMRERAELLVEYAAKAFKGDESAGIKGKAAEALKGLADLKKKKRP